MSGDWRLGRSAQKKTLWISTSRGLCIRLAHVDQLMRSDLKACSLGQLGFDRCENRMHWVGSPMPLASVRACGASTAVVTNDSRNCIA